MRRDYWNNFKDARLIGEFSFIKVLKMYLCTYMKVKQNEKIENEIEILLVNKFYWMRNKLFTGDI